MPAVLRSVVFMKQEAPAAGTRKFEVTCSSCNLRELCLTGCGQDAELERIENIV